MKDAFQAIPEIITLCFNLSLETGIFPCRWKLAKVVPLFKSGDVSNVNNYRPVSLLPLPGKLLEKIVHKHLLNYIETYDLLNSAQGGFRPGHSTTDTIAKFTDDVLLKANDSQCTLDTFIDLRKDCELLVDIEKRPLAECDTSINKRMEKSILKDTSSSTCFIIMTRASCTALCDLCMKGSVDCIRRANEIDISCDNINFLTCGGN